MFYLSNVNDAIRMLKKGKPVLVFDFAEREAEVDIFILAEKMTADKIRLMRKDGGGLICVALHPMIADSLGLIYLHELLMKIDELRDLVKHVPYDPTGRPSFSLTVNHIRTRTGITDIDRALTIRELGLLCNKYWQKEIDKEQFRKEFIQNFRAPGHVFLLRAADHILDERRGHTELAIALALLGNMTPCIALCEMLADDGKALSLEDAKKYAEENDLVIISGTEILNAWKQFITE